MHSSSHEFLVSNKLVIKIMDKIGDGIIKDELNGPGIAILVYRDIFYGYRFKINVNFEIIQIHVIFQIQVVEKNSRSVNANEHPPTSLRMPSRIWSLVNSKVLSLKSNLSTVITSIIVM